MWSIALRSGTEAKGKIFAIIVRRREVQEGDRQRGIVMLHSGGRRKIPQASLDDIRTNKKEEK